MDFVQLKMLSKLSMYVRQNLTYHCKNSYANLKGETTQYEHGLSIKLFNEQIKKIDKRYHNMDIQTIKDECWVGSIKSVVRSKLTFFTINPFLGNAPISYPLKTRKRNVFWCFQGVKHGSNFQKWVNVKYHISSNLFITDRLVPVI